MRLVVERENAPVDRRSRLARKLLVDDGADERAERVAITIERAWPRRMVRDMPPHGRTDVREMPFRFAELDRIRGCGLWCGF